MQNRPSPAFGCGRAPPYNIPAGLLFFRNTVKIPPYCSCHHIQLIIHVQYVVQGCCHHHLRTDKTEFSEVKKPG